MRIAAKWIGSLAVFVLCVGVAGCFDYASADAEFPRNGSFETAGTPAPAGWFLSDIAAGKGRADLHEGMLRLTPNERNLPGGDGLGLGQMQDATPFVGTRLKLSARLGAEDRAQAVAGLVVLDASGNAVEQVFLRQAGPVKAQELETEEALPETARTLILFLTVEGQSGVAYFDDVTLTPVVAAPAAAQSSAALTRFDLATAQPGHAVSPGLFGLNVEWIRNANGLWNEKTGVLDNTMVGLSRKAGLKLIRFPGGVWSDAYHWRDGVGPQADRPSHSHVPGDAETSRHVIGTDEIADFAGRVGAKLLITVNAHTGTPEEAAAWAAYIRDTHGSDIVALWEIGNEHYLADDMAGAHRSPEEYASLLRRFASAIRVEIPDAKIAGIGLLDYGAYRFGAYPDWNEIVLARAGDVIDVFAIHNAYAPITTETRISRGAAVYKAMLAAPEMVAQNLQDTYRQIEQAQPDRAGQIDLAVTEWGALFSVDPKNAYFDHSKTLGSAVFAARIFNVFQRHPDTLYATALKLSDWLNMGWIGLAPGGSWRATPSLLVMELYTDAVAGQVMGVSRQGPDFSSRATGFTAAVKSAPLVDGLFTRRSDGRWAAVINSADLTQSQNIELTLPPGTWRISARQVSGPAPDAHRGTGIREIPGLRFADPRGFSGTDIFVQSSEVTVGISTLPPVEASGSYRATLPPASVTAYILDPAG